MYLTTVYLCSVKHGWYLQGEEEGGISALNRLKNWNVPKVPSSGQKLHGDPGFDSQQSWDMLTISVDPNCLAEVEADS